MNLFNQEFKTDSQAEKIKKGISNKNSSFDRLRQKMINELLKN